MTDMNFDENRRWLTRGLKVSPLASQTFSKSHRYLSGDALPCFIDRGKGSHVWDVDGNEFIDFVLGLGPVTVGYNDPEVNEAIARQLAKGITFSQASTLEVELAEKLTAIVPCAEMVRFVKNGSDATAAAIRLARAATGRDMVACCGYHGMHDWYVGTTALCSGVPEAVRRLTVPFEYNDVAALEAVLETYPDRMAAVIIEPVQAAGPEPGYLAAVRELTHAHGAVLIFDEIVSGFRVALGGAQAHYGVVPDLTALGKGMGNGMPISAVVGRRDLMRQIEDGVFISTTFGGEALSLAAALKTIEILERSGAFEHIWELGGHLMEQTQAMAAAAGLSGNMRPLGLAPHGGFEFLPTDKLTGLDMLSLYQAKLLDRGILSLGINNLCLSHTTDDVTRHLEAIKLALADVATAIHEGQSSRDLSVKRIDPIFPRN